MRINENEVKYLKSIGLGEFVKRSTGHSKNYHVLCSNEAREALEEFHSKKGIVIATAYRDKNGKYIKEEYEEN